MQILKDVASATQFVTSQKLTNRSVGLVPTMGALHKGHLNLMHQCVSETDVGIASIFVNPTQFNNANDLAKYPRTLELDLELLKETGCKAVFCPSADVPYL